MIASHFQPPPERQYGPVSKALYSLLMYGIMWPVSRLLTLFDKWPSMPGIEARLAEAPAAMASASDVFAASYFKSGTTWLMQVITQIAFRGQAEFERIHHVVPWVELTKTLQPHWIPFSDPSPASLSPTGLRAIKTHLPFALTPHSPDARYVAMVRDPKGVAVSSYHFIRSVALGPSMPPFHRWVRKFIAPDFFEGSWAEHLASWWEHRHDANVLFLTYEELRADLAAGVDRIAAFMGVDLSPEERAAVIERSGFAAMKREGDKFDPPLMVPWGKDKAMVREGGSGSSNGKREQLMTPELARQIDDHFRAELRRLGCDFDYDAAFCRSA